jgi:hypothetical protein
VPAFVVEHGLVRRRTDADPWPAVSLLHTVRGVFRCGRHELGAALAVTYDVLRGSGHPFILPLPLNSEYVRAKSAVCSREVRRSGTTVRGDSVLPARPYSRAATICEE